MFMKTDDTLTNDSQPPSRLNILISPHLQKLVKNSPTIAREFIPSEEENNITSNAFSDPLQEDQFIKTKGLVHKYTGRVLIELTLQCAAYCRFCTRRRMVSDIEKGKLSTSDINNMITYLKSHPDIHEVVISGGDPFTVPQLLIKFINQVKKIKHITIIRIHTRVPVSHPQIIPATLYKTLASIRKQVLYLSVHFEHPDEFTKETLKVIKKLRQTGAILLSQSVFLKGVNNNFETLFTLFSRLVELGIRPYYIYRCDPVKGAEHFIVPFEKEVKIMTKLRKNLSGIACPTYVIDTPNGSGKIPVPLNFWSFERKYFHDYNNKQIIIHK